MKALLLTLISTLFVALILFIKPANSNNDLTGSKITEDKVEFKSGAGNPGDTRRVQINGRRAGPVCTAEEYVSGFTYNEDDDDDHITTLSCTLR